MKVEFKEDVDKEVFANYKPFKEFRQKEKIKPGTYTTAYNDLPGTYIDIYECDEIKQRWVFKKFEWFPEGIFGELFEFYDGGDKYDYSIMCERKKFLLAGHILEEMNIDVEGRGWKKLSETALNDVFNN